MDTGSVQWSPPKGMESGSLGMNLPLICLEYLINVGMANTENQMQNQMDYGNNMQPMQSDMIAWFQYLNNLETEAKKSGLSPAQEKTIAKEMAEAYQKMFGQSDPPGASGAGKWNLSGSLIPSGQPGHIGPGTPGYVDPKSDFGKWLIALTKENTNSNGQDINNWPGINGDASVRTVTSQIQNLWNTKVPAASGHGASPNSFGQDLMNWSAGSGSSNLLNDVGNLAANYYAGKQPATSAKATHPTDYLTEFDTDANSCVNIFQGIGTQQTTLLQQLSTTENGYQSNGNSFIQSASGLYSYINQHTGQG